MKKTNYTIDAKKKAIGIIAKKYQIYKQDVKLILDEYENIVNAIIKEEIINNKTNTSNDTQIKLKVFGNKLVIYPKYNLSTNALGKSISTPIKILSYFKFNKGTLKQIRTALDDNSSL